MAASIKYERTYTIVKNVRLHKSFNRAIVNDNAFGESCEITNKCLSKLIVKHYQLLMISAYHYFCLAPNSSEKLPLNVFVIGEGFG